MIDLGAITGANSSFANTLLVGEVIDNKDSQKRGRVKVFVPQLHKSKDVAELPWALPISPSFGGGNGSKNWGWYAIPRIGDMVVLMSLLGDINTLCYFGSIRSTRQLLPETPDTAGSTDPTTYELQTHNGHRFVIRTGSDSEIRLETEKGHYLSIDDANGNITTKTKKGYSVVVDDSGDKITANVGASTITMTSSGAITISGANSVSISGGASVTITGGTVNIN